MEINLVAYIVTGILVVSSYMSCMRVKRARNMYAISVPLWFSSRFGETYLNTSMFLAAITGYVVAAYGVTHAGWAMLMHFLWFGIAYVLIIRSLFGGDVLGAVLLPITLVPGAIWLGVIW